LQLIEKSQSGKVYTIEMKGLVAVAYLDVKEKYIETRLG
jgi:hypothetical protein